MSKALLKAAAAGQTEQVEVLLAQGADIDFVDKAPGRTALIEAALNGHLDTVQRLVEKGAQVNRTDSTMGFSALGWAAHGGYREVLASLLAAGADVELTGNLFRHTPLMVAAQKGHTAVIEALLAAGANLHTQTGDGRNALSMAEDREHAESVALLLRSGARAPVAPEETYLPWPLLRDDLADVDDSDPASVLRGYILAMHRWESDCHEHSERVGWRDLDWDFIRQGLAQIVERFCTPKPRPQGRGNGIKWPPDYQPGEALVSLDCKGRRATLMTRQAAGGSMRYEAQYNLVRTGDNWRIDTKKDRPWGTDTWERSIL